MGTNQPGYVRSAVARQGARALDADLEGIVSKHRVASIGPGQPWRVVRYFPDPVAGATLLACSGAAIINSGDPTDKICDRCEHNDGPEDDLANAPRPRLLLA